MLVLPAALYRQPWDVAKGRRDQKSFGESVCTPFVICVSWEEGQGRKDL